MTTKSFKYVLSALTLIGLSGCATVKNNYVPQTEQISFPALNTIRTVSLGEPLLQQGTATTTKGVYLTQENNIHGHVLSPGFYPQSGEDDEYVYTTFDFRRTTTDIGFVTPAGLTGGIYPVGLRFAKNRQESCAVVAGVYGISQASCDTEHGFQFVERPMLSANDFQQTLIYSGRVGSRVRISYREASGNVARPDFANEAEYDLSVSDTIAYRGARLRVISADNERIEYQVLANFNVTP